MAAKPSSLTRHGHSTSVRAMSLPPDHPAVVEGRPLFLKSANEHKRGVARVLVSGHNSRKIGRVVTKGKWSGMPIYTLTLEERRTCPRACLMWSSCYGNRMPWSLRWPAGASTEARIETELAELQASHPGGFVVRLHVLGDFYSVEYVDRWAAWLRTFPALRCYGYTARGADDPIGLAVQSIATANWDRFAVRSSGGVLPDLPSAAAVGRGEPVPQGIVCPVEVDKSATCGTCALCWANPKMPIVFLEH